MTRPSTVLLMSVLLVMVLPLAPAAASADAGTDRAQQLLDVLAQDRGGQASFAESDSWTDAEGDATNLETREVVDEPRVDIVEHDLDYTSETLVLRGQVVQPTNPTTDPGWQQNTLFGWFLDVDGDDAGDFFVDYSLTIDETEEIEVIVTSVIAGTQGPDQCPGQATGSFDGTWYIASIPSDCIDSPGSVAPNPGMTYQPNNGQPTYNDFAPNDGNFENAVQITEVEEPPVEVTGRTPGGNRFETAVLGSQMEFPNGADVVYLARADIFADAVAGGSLTGGPILLVPSCGPVPDVVLAEIARLGPSTVYALGGEAAICGQVLGDALNAAGEGAEAGRIAGPNRFQTAVAISQFQFPLNATNVFLARADIFADAVAGGALTSGPILLVPSCDDVPQAVLDEIQRLLPTGVYALGGEAAVCQDVLEQAAAAAPTAVNVGRLAGNDRIGTAVAISQFQFPDGADRVYLARADVLADAVAAGGLTGGPILLSPNCGPLPEVIADEIIRLDAELIIALGGDAAICEALLQAAGQVVIDNNL